MSYRWSWSPAAHSAEGRVCLTGTMQKAAALIFITICALSAPSWVEGIRRSKPSASVGPAQQFGSTSPTPSANTTTPTPKPNTTTTTPKPTTTTPKPTTTTPPSTTPSTNLTVGNYNLTLKGQICLMALMTLQIRLTTEQANGTFIVQPSKTKATGECAETNAKLTLTFQEGYIYFHFNKSEDMVYADTLSFSLNYPFEKGAKLPYTASNQSLHLFSARTGHSYSCKSQSVDMGKGLYLDVTQTRLQAIGLQNANFGKPDACPADQPDYRVAIAVGVTLLILIVVVIIVYFLGRRRRTEGYQSL
ncbi:lysosome-associated membrane glycoprotein 1 isoform X5 [Oryzias latipes]